MLNLYGLTVTELEKVGLHLSLASSPPPPPPPQVPEGGEQFTLRILSDSSGITLGAVEAAITVVARGSSVFQIREEDRWGRG